MWIVLLNSVSLDTFLHCIDFFLRYILVNNLRLPDYSDIILVFVYINDTYPPVKLCLSVHQCCVRFGFLSQLTASKHQHKTDLQIIFDSTITLTKVLDPLRQWKNSIVDRNSKISGYLQQRKRKHNFLNMENAQFPGKYVIQLGISRSNSTLSCTMITMIVRTILSNYAIIKKIKY